MKRLLLFALAFALVAIFASVKLRRRPADPATVEGSWEPAPQSTP